MWPLINVRLVMKTRVATRPCLHFHKSQHKLCLLVQPANPVYKQSKAVFPLAKFQLDNASLSDTQQSLTNLPWPPWQSDTGRIISICTISPNIFTQKLCQCTQVLNYTDLNKNWGGTLAKFQLDNASDSDTGQSLLNLPWSPWAE